MPPRRSAAPSPNRARTVAPSGGIARPRRVHGPPRPAAGTIRRSPFKPRANLFARSSDGSVPSLETTRPSCITTRRAARVLRTPAAEIARCRAWDLPSSASPRSRAARRVTSGGVGPGPTSIREISQTSAPALQREHRGEEQHEAEADAPVEAAVPGGCMSGCRLGSLRPDGRQTCSRRPTPSGSACGSAGSTSIFLRRRFTSVSTLRPVTNDCSCQTSRAGARA